MKILPVIHNERRHLLNTSSRIRELSKQGYEIGSRSANIYKTNKAQKYCGIIRCISDKMWKNVTKDDLPYIAGTLGLFVPLPLISPIAMGVGFILKFLLPDSGTTKDNKSHTV